MKTDFKILTIAGLTLALAGCSSSSTEPSEPVALASFVEVQAAAETMATNYIDLDSGALLAETVSKDAIPTSGGITYHGFVGGTVESGAIAGELTMIANFGGETVTGTADNFYHDVDGALTGVLDLNNGIINNSGGAGTPQIHGDLQGTLAGTIVTDIALNGDFFDADLGVVAGTADGFFGEEFLEGAFVASE